MVERAPRSCTRQKAAVRAAAPSRRRARSRHAAPPGTRRPRPGRSTGGPVGGTHRTARQRGFRSRGQADARSRGVRRQARLQRRRSSHDRNAEGQVPRRHAPRSRQGDARPPGARAAASHSRDPFSQIDALGRGGRDVRPADPVARRDLRRQVGRVHVRRRRRTAGNLRGDIGSVARSGRAPRRLRLHRAPSRGARHRRPGRARLRHEASSWPRRARRAAGSSRTISWWPKT